MADKPDRHVRAHAAVRRMAQRLDAVIDGTKQQLDDVKEVGDEILSDPPTTGDRGGKLIANVAALWINGVTLGARAIFGFPDGR